MHKSSSTIMRGVSSQEKARLHTPPFCNTQTQNNNPKTQQEVPKFPPPGVPIIAQLTDGVFFNSGCNGQIFVSQWMKTQVAIKVAIEEKSSDSHNQEEDIKKEISFLAKVNHPLIVRMYGVGLGTQVGIVMEYIDGHTLAEICTEPVTFEPPKNTERLRYCALDILKALVYLHSVGILHCDLTPYNVMIHDSNPTCGSHVHAKLIDFGRSRRKTNRYEVTPNGKIMPNGAPTRTPYAAPEAFLSSTKTITAAYDVYVFGVLLWQMITAQTPYENLFGAPGQYLIEKAIRNGKTNEIPKTIPPQVQEIIEKCWAYKPTARPTAQWILTELHKFLNVRDSLELVEKEGSYQNDIEQEAKAFYPSVPEKNVRLYQQHTLSEEKY